MEKIYSFKRLKEIASTLRIQEEFEQFQTTLNPQPLQNKILDSLEDLLSSEKHQTFRIMDLERELGDEKERNTIEQEEMRDKIESMFKQIIELKEQLDGQGD